jgi:hypothetical protein
MTNPVDEFLAAVVSGKMLSCGVFASEAELDATVPNWRFSVHGGGEVRAELARWYVDPGRFDEVRRTPTADGEHVEFTLCWEENGIPHACHQVDMFTMEGQQIVSHRAWCGGRWPASLLADMAAAARAAH